MHQNFVLQALTGIGRKARALLDVEGIDGFDQSDGADADEVLLLAAVRVVLFHDMRHKAEVVLDELGARGLIPLPAEHEQAALLLLAQRRREGGGGRGAQKEADQLGKDGDQKGEHRISPLILYALHSVNMLYANRSASLRTCFFNLR